MMEGSSRAECRNRVGRQYILEPWQFPHISVASQIHGENGFLFSFDKIISPSARQAI